MTGTLDIIGEFLWQNRGMVMICLVLLPAAFFLYVRMLRDIKRDVAMRSGPPDSFMRPGPPKGMKPPPTASPRKRSRYNPLPVDEEVYPVVRDWKCEYCGTVNWSSMKECSNCGAPMAVSRRVEMVDVGGMTTEEAGRTVRKKGGGTPMPPPE